MISNIR